MSKDSKHFYEFGPFRLDPIERQLRRDGEVIPLMPKAFEVLLLLVRNSRHVLTKEEVMKEVWKDSFVEEKNLTDNISILRKALADNPKQPAYIETVTRHGYRFMAEVREMPGDNHELVLAESVRTRVLVEEEEPASLTTSGTPLPALPATKNTGQRNLIILLAGVVAVAISLVVYFLIRKPTPAPAQLQQFKSLAVLPLKPLAGASADDAYLGPGLADALINRLSSVRQITVRPTSAVLKYGGGAHADLVAVAREQAVDAVLDGSFQRAGDRVRVTVQLVRGSDGAPLWANTFDEKFTDIFTVQDVISQRVAGALVPKLTNEETAGLTKRETENSDAYRLYLTGRYFWNKRTAEGFQKAIEYYERAIAADPNYALAHAGLAESYVLLPNWTGAPPEESFTRAEQSARRALELDPQLAEAYTALGAVKIYLYRDWAGGGEDYRRATELNPNYATGRQWYGEWLCSAGRLAEALAELEAAQRLDPLSPIVTFEYGVALYYSRRPAEAEAQFRKALELDPGFFRAHVFLSRIYFDSGRDEESIRERALVLARGDETKAARFEALFRTAYRAGGREAYLRKQLEMRNDPGVFHANKVGGWVESCALLRDKDCTFEALREVERTRHPFLDSIKVDPYFDFIRDDPRYTELLRRLNLPL